MTDENKIDQSRVLILGDGVLFIDAYPVGVITMIDHAGIELQACAEKTSEHSISRITCDEYIVELPVPAYVNGRENQGVANALFEALVAGRHKKIIIH